MCRGLRQRRHGDPEHPDRRRGHLSRSAHSHLHGVPQTLHLPHTRNHQLQS
uniref:Uncharacterized protein n=1 Tax=Anguilla anguilla TaxID=7936 RepID=A0A0E9QMI8_ANGAN